MTYPSLAQRGQAVVEAALVLLVLGPLFVGIAWLGKLQYGALEAAQSSRQSAFLAAHGQTAEGFDAPVRVEESFDSWLVPEVGNGHAAASGLADDWLRSGRGVLRAQSTVNIPTPKLFNGEHAAREMLSVRRSTSILVGAGHGQGDAATQQRIKASDKGWSSVAAMSSRHASHLRNQLQRLDISWRRREVSLEWLAPWADLVPAERLIRTNPQWGR